MLQKIENLTLRIYTPGNHTNHNLIPNLSGPMKLEFPRFFGVEPTSWIYKANQYFTYYNILDNEKLMMASFHMDGEALVWFQEGEDVGVIRNWEALVQALLIKFGTPAYVDPMEALTRLRQTLTMALYKGEFKALSNRIRSLSHQHKFSCFLSGLKDEVRVPMRMLNSPTLIAAFGLATIQEEYLLGCKKSYKIPHEHVRPSLLGLSKVGTPVDTRNKIPVKRISPSQMEERKKKGLGYNCDDKWVPRYKCKNATLFLLVGVDIIHNFVNGVQLSEIEDEVTIGTVQEEGVEVEITRYALVGSSTPRKIRVKERVKTVSLVNLLDFRFWKYS